MDASGSLAQEGLASVENVCCFGRGRARHEETSWLVARVSGSVASGVSVLWLSQCWESCHDISLMKLKLSPNPGTLTKALNHLKPKARLQRFQAEPGPLSLLRSFLSHSRCQA